MWAACVLLQRLLRSYRSQKDPNAEAYKVINTLYLLKRMLDGGNIFIYTDLINIYSFANPPHISVSQEDNAKYCIKKFKKEGLLKEQKIEENKEKTYILQSEIPVEGLIALDVGASTGGFTDCLLQNGCHKVVALDVGHGQLDWKLRNNPRVIVMERTNARFLNETSLNEPVDCVVIDVSFISLTKIIPAVLSVVKPSGFVLALIKPQFEVGKGQVGKGGVIRDPQIHQKIISELSDFFRTIELSPRPVIASPLLGPKGNREFFIFLQPR